MIALKSAGTGAQMLKAVTGIKAHSAEILGKEMLQKVKELVKSSEEMEVCEISLYIFLLLVYNNK